MAKTIRRTLPMPLKWPYDASAGNSWQRLKPYASLMSFQSLISFNSPLFGHTAH